MAWVLSRGWTYKRVKGLDGLNDVYMLHLRDSRTEKQFPEMTNRERAAASRAGSDLRWNGPATWSRPAAYLTAGADSTRSREDACRQGVDRSLQSSDLEPDELMEPSGAPGVVGAHPSLTHFPHHQAAR